MLHPKPREPAMAKPARALIVIDLQNDYFAGGNFPLWNAEAALANVEAAIARANAAEIPVVLVQHVANASKGPAPFFNPGTSGVEIHPRIRAAAPHAPLVVKQFADAFYGTELETTLRDLGVEELLVCGMMTQNCVTHTAISKSAEKYKVTILPECCTTVSEILHRIALGGVATRVPLVSADIALG
jgi:nicotinamidase-related amidase